MHCECDTATASLVSPRALRRYQPPVCSATRSSTVRTWLLSSLHCTFVSTDWSLVSTVPPAPESCCVSLQGGSSCWTHRLLHPCISSWHFSCWGQMDGTVRTEGRALWRGCSEWLQLFTNQTYHQCWSQFFIKDKRLKRNSLKKNKEYESSNPHRSRYCSSGTSAPVLQLQPARGSVALIYIDGYQELIHNNTKSIIMTTISCPTSKHGDTKNTGDHSGSRLHACISCFIKAGATIRQAFVLFLSKDQGVPSQLCKTALAWLRHETQPLSLPCRFAFTDWRLMSSASAAPKSCCISLLGSSISVYLISQLLL